MLRKGSEMLKGDKEVLLDLDYGGEAQTSDGYGSLQNGSFIPPRCVSTVFLFPLMLQCVFLSPSSWTNTENNCTPPHSSHIPVAVLIPSHLTDFPEMLQWTWYPPEYTVVWAGVYHRESQTCLVVKTWLHCTERFLSATLGDQFRLIFLDSLQSGGFYDAVRWHRILRLNLIKRKWTVYIQASGSQAGKGVENCFWLPLSLVFNELTIFFINNN